MSRGRTRWDRVHLLITLATLAALAALALAGCKEGQAPASKPLPEAEAAALRKKLGGLWGGQGLRLHIFEDGSASYSRTRGMETLVSKNEVTTSMDGQISALRRDSFVFLNRLTNLTFKIDRLPREEKGTWRMTIDGIEVTRLARVKGKEKVGWEEALTCVFASAPRCLRPQSTFKPDEYRVSVAYATKTIPTSQESTITWWHKPKEGEERNLGTVSGTYIPEKMRWASYFFVTGALNKPKSGTYPLGTYRAEIRIGGKLVAKAPFEISGETGKKVEEGGKKGEKGEKDKKDKKDKKGS